MNVKTHELLLFFLLYIVIVWCITDHFCHTVCRMKMSCITCWSGTSSNLIPRVCGLKREKERESCRHLNQTYFFQMLFIFFLKSREANRCWTDPPRMHIVRHCETNIPVKYLRFFDSRMMANAWNITWLWSLWSLCLEMHVSSITKEEKSWSCFSCVLLWIAVGDLWGSPLARLGNIAAKLRLSFASGQFELNGSQEKNWILAWAFCTLWSICSR